jgi:hypothetical protein
MGSKEIVIGEAFGEAPCRGAQEDHRDDFLLIGEAFGEAVMNIFVIGETLGKAPRGGGGGESHHDNFLVIGEAFGKAPADPKKVIVMTFWSSRAFWRPSLGLSSLHFALKLAVTPGMACLMVQPYTVVFCTCFLGTASHFT